MALPFHPCTLSNSPYQLQWVPGFFDMGEQYPEDFRVIGDAVINVYPGALFAYKHDSGHIEITETKLIQVLPTYVFSFILTPGGE
jgi:hypothetical protein